MILLRILLLMIVTPVLAAEDLTVTLDQDVEIPVRLYPAEGSRAILWLPSEFGLSARQRGTAEGLAERGIEVWTADLHTAWFLPAGRYSFDSIDPQAIGEFVHRVQRRSGKKLYLMASGRAAAVALDAVRYWQVTYYQEEALGGAVIFHPMLYTRTPQGGESAEFLPLARAVNVPLYLFQPEHSALFWRIAEVAEVLAEGGAPTYLHVLKGVSDGFHLRPDLRPGEAEMTARLPVLVETALELLEASGDVPAQAAPVMRASAMRDERGSDLLRPYPGDASAPGLKLRSMDGGTFDLAAYKGRPVVLNFWATWCPPCVEEIPSLERLRALREDQGLLVVTVDVGEAPEEVRAFLEDKPVSFPVLLDEEAEAFRAWSAYAFPTTFILDAEHRLRYSVFGAFAWDGAEVLEVVDGLLD